MQSPLSALISHKVQEAKIIRDDKTVSVIFGFSDYRELSLSEMEKRLPMFCDEDADRFQKMAAVRRKKAFLAGGFLIEDLCREFWKDCFPRIFSIQRGVLGFPIIQADSPIVPEVSLSHSRGYSAGFLFPAGQQAALDLELVEEKENRIRAIRSVLSDNEKVWVDQQNESNVLSHYRLWTIKEGLSKALRTGLSIPLRLLETESLVWEEDRLTARFKNFTQYKAHCFTINAELVVCIVLPWKSRLVFSD